MDLVFAPKVPSVGSHGREPVVKWPPPFSAFAASACGRRKCGVEGFAAGGILVAAWLCAQVLNRDYGFGVADMPWLGVIVPVFLMIAFQIPLKLPGLKSPKAGIITMVVLAVVTLIGILTMEPRADDDDSRFPFGSDR